MHEDTGAKKLIDIDELVTLYRKAVDSGDRYMIDSAEAAIQAGKAAEAAISTMRVNEATAAKLLRAMPRGAGCDD